jgi:putative phosphoribosyl transferase
MHAGVIPDRAAAGRMLAERLEHYRDQPGCLVAALPRGGVVVGAGIARRLRVPLDVLIVRKLGVPWQPELAMGAIASGGAHVLNADVVREMAIGEEEIAAVTASEQKELERREQVYRAGRPPVDFESKTVILADDGIATGATMSVAIEALRTLKAGRIVVAVGVAPPDTVRRLEREADEVVCVSMPSPFQAISLWYRDFPQCTDSEVRRLLGEAAA